MYFLNKFVELTKEKLIFWVGLLKRLIINKSNSLGEYGKKVFGKISKVSMVITFLGVNENTHCS